MKRNNQSTFLEHFFGASGVIWFCAVIAILTAIFPNKAKAEEKVQLPKEGIGIATGPSGKGFSKFFKDIQAVCGAKNQMYEVNSEGGLDNLNLLVNNKADIGFTMIDAWKKMGELDDKIGNLKPVMTTNNSFLHILVRVGGHTVVAGKKWYGAKEEQVVYIKKFSDLRNRPVALVGTTQLMGRRLNELYQMNFAITDVASDEEAFNMLKQGQVFAVMTISGLPNGKVDKLGDKDGLTLAAFDYKAEAPYKVGRMSYRNLGQFGTEALSVQNVLLTRPFGGSKAKAVADIKACILANLQDLKDGRGEPGWSEVNKQ